MDRNVAAVHGGRKTVWGEHVLETAPSGQAKAFLALDEYDCSGNRHRVLEATGYDEDGRIMGTNRQI